MLAEPSDQGSDSLPGLKFDPKSPNGLGKGAFKSVHSLGPGTFTQVRIGQADTFNLTPDEAGQRYLRGRLKAGGAIWIVVVPDDQDVAATCFGPAVTRGRIQRD